MNLSINGNRFYAEQIMLEMSSYSLPVSDILKSSMYNCTLINLIRYGNASRLEEMEMSNKR